jgi:hypothetical protein
MNWIKRIEKAEELGYFTAEDVFYAARYNTCAVGEAVGFGPSLFMSDEDFKHNTDNPVWDIVFPNAHIIDVRTDTLYKFSNGFLLCSRRE